MATATCIPSARLTRTVLVADLVGGGGDPGRNRVARARRAAIVDREVERFEGQPIEASGDQVLAVFDGPHGAIRCARSLAAAAARAGFEVRAGIHAGDIERQEVGGLTFFVGSRLADLARAGEVLVSDAIPPLVPNGDVAFADQGEHALRGVPGRWRLFSAPLHLGAPTRNGRATPGGQVVGMRTPSPVPDLEALRRIPGLETGATAELIALGSMSGRCNLAAGQVVVRPGVLPAHVLLVVSGTVEARVAGGEAELLRAGAMVGLRALRSGADHQEEAVVSEDAEVLAVRADVVDRLLTLPSVDRLLRRAPLASATMARRQVRSDLSGLGEAAAGAVAREAG